MNHNMKKNTYNITTFGCQMNERDSERISGFLNERGFLESPEDNAELIIINTCTVRENANNKLYGHLGYLKSKKTANPELKIALCGCMMQEEQVVAKIRESYPFVDLIFGTQNIEKFPILLDSILENNHIYDTDAFENEDYELINTHHKIPFKCGVNIMFGCNNFCTYCIVPYVRGREKSRSPEEILKEISLLAKDGVSEIMLLGQNVNSYGKTLDKPISFAKLLEMVHKIDGIKRIRFMTSHPKDLSSELIDTIRQLPKICKHIHLPLQSGSSRILSLMNRHYTKEDYLKLCDELREKIPEISITTDIIVGFPGENDRDIDETLDVISKIKFDSAFTFIYSKRTGTPAANFVDESSSEQIKNRFNKVLSLVQDLSREQILRFVGNTETVLVERENERENGLVTGRMDSNLIVHFPGDSSLIGKYIDVKIVESRGFYFVGERV